MSEARKYTTKILPKYINNKFFNRYMNKSNKLN